MLRASQSHTPDQAARIDVQLLTLLERAARQQSSEDLPGLPGAKRPEEEVLLAC